jgi:hypothetical protein
MPQDMHNADTEVIGHSTPLRAVRRHCLSCCDGSFTEVRLCTAKSCPLWPFRHGRRPIAQEKAAVAERPVYPLERSLAGASALRAIRRRCIDCSGNNDAEVRSCAYGPNHSAPCSLHAFRAAQTHSSLPGVTSGSGRLPSAYPWRMHPPCQNAP